MLPGAQYDCSVRRGDAAGEQLEQRELHLLGATRPRRYRPVQRERVDATSQQQRIGGAGFVAIGVDLHGGDAAQHL